MQWAGAACLPHSDELTPVAPLVQSVGLQRLACTCWQCRLAALSPWQQHQEPHTFSLTHPRCPLLAATPPPCLPPTAPCCVQLVPVPVAAHVAAQLLPLSQDLMAWFQRERRISPAALARSRVCMVQPSPQRAPAIAFPYYWGDVLVN